MISCLLIIIKRTTKSTKIISHRMIIICQLTVTKCCQDIMENARFIRTMCQYYLFSSNDSCVCGCGFEMVGQLPCSHMTIICSLLRKEHLGVNQYRNCDEIIFLFANRFQTHTAMEKYVDEKCWKLNVTFLAYLGQPMDFSVDHRTSFIHTNCLYRGCMMFSGCLNWITWISKLINNVFPEHCFSTREPAMLMKSKSETSKKWSKTLSIFNLKYFIF